METIEQYIKSKLSELKTLSLDLSYKYAYDTKTSFHIVEISPYSLLENDAVFDVIFDIQTTVYGDYPECNFIYSNESPYNNMNNLLDTYDSQRIISFINKNTFIKSPSYDFMIFNECDKFCIAA